MACMAIAGSANAGDSSNNSLKDPTDLSLDELINIQITSVSKKEEKLDDAAAAISVLNNDELRRSGATSVAEALRLIPGMDVAQINSSQWAVSARGFNETYSRSLLVLVDGRAVYTPWNGGVLWNLQQQMLEDLDRIEVIRGPGGTLWGANAVNGVVNIVSKSARDTQGGLVYGSGGDPHFTMDGARYGGMLGSNTYYRVFGSYQLNNQLDSPQGSPGREGKAAFASIITPAPTRTPHGRVISPGMTSSTIPRTTTISTRSDVGHARCPSSPAWNCRPTSTAWTIRKQTPREA
jgi:outer membrane cobalamin receptor